MKALIKKVDELFSNPRFQVYAVNAEGKEMFATSFSFKYDVPTDDIYNEQLNFNKALKAAKAIESLSDADHINSSLTIVSTVYETKSDQKTK